MDVEFVVKIPRGVLLPPDDVFCRKRLSDRIRDIAVEALAAQHPKLYAAAVAASTAATTPTFAVGATGTCAPAQATPPVAAPLTRTASALPVSLPPPPEPPRLPPWVSKKPDTPLTVPIAKRRRVYFQHSSKSNGGPSATQVRFEKQPTRKNGDGDPKSPPFRARTMQTHRRPDGVVRKLLPPVVVSKKPQKSASGYPLRYRIPFLARNVASGIRQLPQDQADTLGFGPGKRKSTAGNGSLDNMKFNCLYCTAKYVSQWKVDNHVRRNHFDNTALFHCDEPTCDFSFATVLSYQSHKQRRHGNSGVQCPRISY